MHSLFSSQYLTLLFIGVLHLPLLIILNWSKRNPSSNVNKYIGYRSKRSMKSQSNWDRAQTLGPQFIIQGLWISLLGSFFMARAFEVILGSSLTLLVACASLVTALLWGIWKTELDLEAFEQ